MMRCLALALLLPAVASAQTDTVCTNSPTNVAANWTDGLPTAAKRAVFDAGLGTPNYVSLNADFTAASVVMTNWPSGMLHAGNASRTITTTNLIWTSGVISNNASRELFFRNNANAFTAAVTEVFQLGAVTNLGGMVTLRSDGPHTDWDWSGLTIPISGDDFALVNLRPLPGVNTVTFVYTNRTTANVVIDAQNVSAAGSAVVLVSNTLAAIRSTAAGVTVYATNVICESGGQAYGLTHFLPGQSYLQDVDIRAAYLIDAQTGTSSGSWTRITLTVTNSGVGYIDLPDGLSDQLTVTYKPNGNYRITSGGMPVTTLAVELQSGRTVLLQSALAVGTLNNNGSLDCGGNTLTAGSITNAATGSLITSNSSIYATNIVSTGTVDAGTSTIYLLGGTSNLTNYHSLVPVGSTTLTNAAISIAGTLSSQQGASLNAAGGTLTLSNAGTIDGQLRNATVTGAVLQVNQADSSSGSYNEVERE